MCAIAVLDQKRLVRPRLNRSKAEEILAKVVASVFKRLMRPVLAFRCRYCIDNGAMIAQAGVFQYMHTGPTPLAETTCTQRFRTDAVDVAWRPP